MASFITVEEANTKYKAVRKMKLLALAHSLDKNIREKCEKGLDNISLEPFLENFSKDEIDECVRLYFPKFEFGGKYICWRQYF